MMERVFERGFKVLLAMLLAAATGIPLTGRGALQPAYADEPALLADDEVKLTIKAGAATPVDGQANTYCFPDLKVATEPADAKFQSITVQFTTGIASGDDIYYSSTHQKNNSEALPAGFSRFSGNKTGNRSVNYTVSGGATAEQWQDFLKRYLTISLADGNNTKGLRIVASLAPVDKVRDYNSLNGHYYEVGDGTCSWDQALRKAEEHTYMGMRGYLVTVTSRAEQDFVFSLVHTDTWIGGTCDDTYATRASSWAQGYRTNNADVKTRWSDVPTFIKGQRSHYYWVSGPEAGLRMGDCYNSSDRVPAINPETGEEMFMFWAEVQPDGPYTSNEKWIQLAVQHGTGVNDKHGEWNDLPIDYGGIRYIIEYGGMPDDVDVSDGQGGADATVDVYVKVDIIVDPTGRTLTTEAGDVQVGQPLDVQENVNGDPEVKTHIIEDGNETGTKPATVKRTYQIKDPGSEGADAHGWRPLRPDEMNGAGEPVHAGTYRVTSTGVYSAAPDGTTIQEYVAGEATFSIKPKAVDATAPATAPGDPSAPDASQDSVYTDPVTGEKTVISGRGWSKVYDGSPYLAAGNASLSDSLLSGDQAWLTFERAEFSDSAAGSRDLRLYGVKVAGPSAGDYRIAGVGADGTLTVKGAILPRDLVISSQWFKAPGTDPATWVKNVPFVDPAGAPVGRYTNAAEFDSASVTTMADDGAGHSWPVAWPANMLAPGDKIAPLLGEASFVAATPGGLVLNLLTPQIGTYALNFSFANVLANAGSAALTADGNYRVVLKPAPLKVTDRITVNLTEDGPLEVMRSVEPVKPVPDPVTKDELTKIAEDVFGPDAPAPGGGQIPEGVDPVVVIKKGGVPVNEIDPSVPGEYEVTITYPAPDGTDYVVEVDYVVGADPIPSPGEGLYTVVTRLVGATQGASITPTRVLKAGASGSVEWRAGSDCYVASVEVDGRAIDIVGSSWAFHDLKASHEVVVTLARNPIIEGSATGGFYTIAVNRYGEAAGVTVSPSAVLTAGADGRVTWAPTQGYRISAVWVDGKQLSAAAVASGAVNFSGISANHVVDVYVERTDGSPALRADDVLVTTSIKGGPGTITGSSTVAVGGDYRVEWQPVVQTTPDVENPSYAVYEVASIEVNGAEAAGIDERELQLSNIKENKDVVVTLRPVVYDVAVLSYGPGTASSSRTLFKGQGYVDISGAPSGSARITYIEVDGKAVYDERAPHAAQVLANDVADASQMVLRAMGEEFSGVAASQEGRDQALSAVRDVELVLGRAYAGTSAARAAEPVFPAPVTDVRQADGAALDMGIAGIDADHVVKVYFADEHEGPANPDTVTDKADVTSGVEGGPGSVAVGDGTGFVNPDEDQKVTWEIPDGYVPSEVVIGDTRIPVPPGATEVVIPGGTLESGDHVSLVVEKREPGDESVPSRERSNDVVESLRIETLLTGGEGTITGSTSVDRHGNHTVTWAPAPGYRVAKVIVDGVERPDLLNKDSITFEDIGENHSVQIVLEPAPGAAGSGGDDGSGSDADKWKTLTGHLRLAQTGDGLLGIVGGMGLLALASAAALAIARRRMGA